jgi:hypothetical protein
MKKKQYGWAEEGAALAWVVCGVPVPGNQTLNIFEFGFGSLTLHG